MHPFERLRYVARAEGADPLAVAREAAAALGEVATGDVAGLVPACRRLVERHPTNGALWWVAARVLSSPDPLDAAREASGALAHDPTGRRLAEALPDDTSVLIVGWSGLGAQALSRRGDLEALVLDGGGDGTELAVHLAASDREVTVVPDRGVGPAATLAGVVVVEALVAGPSGLLAPAGSHAAAVVAAAAGVPVWAVLGVGRLLPEVLWKVVLDRVDAGGLEPWDRECQLVPVALLDSVVDSEGARAPGDALLAATCPAAPELLRLSP